MKNTGYHIIKVELLESGMEITIMLLIGEMDQMIKQEEKHHSLTTI